jgi:cystathionine beta-synthase
MRSYGFADATESSTVGDILKAKTGGLPALVHAHPSDTVRDAIQIMTSYGVSQLPILSAEPPVVMGEVTGSLNEQNLLDEVFSGRAAMTDQVGGFASDPLPLIGIHESVAAARTFLGKAGALLVTDDGKPVAVITRHDLLTFLSE